MQIPQQVCTQASSVKQHNSFLAQVKQMWHGECYNKAKKSLGISSNISAPAEVNGTGKVQWKTVKDLSNPLSKVQGKNQKLEVHKATRETSYYN